MQYSVITGATSGFGKVVAKFLVERGDQVIVLARNKEKFERLRAELNEASNMEYIHCDLCSFDSIKKACEDLKTEQKIDNLILNAGLWNSVFEASEDGIEQTFQANLLAPAYIIQTLEQNLAPKAKVIITSSGLHQGVIDFENIEFKNSFSGFKAYRQSKLGVILIARYLADKMPNESKIFTVHPGMVKTELGRKAGWFSRLIFKLFGTSLENGAKTHLHLLRTDIASLESGGYYAKSQLTQTTKESYDMDMAAQLYERIEQYLEAFK